MEKITLYSSNNAMMDESDKRKVAVEVALELIRARAASDVGQINIAKHLERLGEYADYIQAALDIEE